MNKNNISIFYIARGKDQKSISLFKNFAKSYTAHPAPHNKANREEGEIIFEVSAEDMGP